MPFEDLPVEPDPNVVLARILTGIDDNIPGWEPYEGDPVVVLAEEIGRETATSNARMQLAMRLAVAGIGVSVHGLPVEVGSTATLTTDVTVTVIGAVIPSGLTIVATTGDGDRVAFIYAGDAIVTTTLVTSVVFTATDVGTYANNIPAEQSTAISQATLGVVSVSSTTPSAGGSDPETLVSYLDRLTDYLSVLRPGGVLAADLAALARSVTGAYRAIGVDNLNGMSLQTGQERTATVYVVDQAGQPVSDVIKANVIDRLEDSREVGFLIFVNDPTYTPLTVVYEVVSEGGSDLGVVKANVETAIAAFLDPATWGSSATDRYRGWSSTSHSVRHNDLVIAIGRAAGVASVVTVTVNGSDGDVDLGGVVALPAPLVATTFAPVPTTITGTAL